MVVVPPVVVVLVVPVVVPLEPEPEDGVVELSSYRSVARLVSVLAVSAAFGWNFFTLFAISLCWTTVAICGAAQLGVVLEAATATAAAMAATAQAAASVAKR